jgi:hypothetical protein
MLCSQNEFRISFSELLNLYAVTHLAVRRLAQFASKHPLDLNCLVKLDFLVLDCDFLSFDLVQRCIPHRDETVRHLLQLSVLVNHCRLVNFDFI